MKTILFNFHDLVLASVVAFCALLALLSAANTRIPGGSRGFIIAFFVLYGMTAFDTLVFWGEGVKYAAFELWPWLLTLFSFAAFALGPILYWLMRSELRPNSRFAWQQYLHLLPAVATPFYLYWACYSKPVDVQRQLILNLGLYGIPEVNFLAFVVLKKLSPVAYGVFSIWPLLRRTSGGEIAKPRLSYLLWLSCGFTSIQLLGLLIHFAAHWFAPSTLDVFGIVGNYLVLCLLGVLLVMNFSGTASISHPSSEASAGGAESLALAQQVRHLVEQQKPYLNPRLTLERFSEPLDTPPRQVSAAINRHFQQNFQEYINRHRVEAAKQLLRSHSASGLTILEIGQMAGFNSKATFNRIFKNTVSMTPTSYRQQLGPTLASSAAQAQPAKPEARP